MTHNSRRLLLRERTSDAHAALDATVGTLNSIAAYRRYVAALHAFRAPVEAQLAASAWPGNVDRLPADGLTHLLEADMRDVGLDLPNPPREAVTPLDGIEELLGVLYVLEGSSLGAHILYRQAKALGFTAEHGARHLAHQTASPARWRGFLGLLEAAGFPDGMDRCVRTSVATFARAQRAFAGDVDVAA